MDKSITLKENLELMHFLFDRETMFEETVEVELPEMEESKTKECYKEDCNSTDECKKDCKLSGELSKEKSSDDIENNITTKKVDEGSSVNLESIGSTKSLDNMKINKSSSIIESRRYTKDGHHHHHHHHHKEEEELEKKMESAQKRKEKIKGLIWKLERILFIFYVLFAAGMMMIISFGVFYSRYA